MLSRFDDKEEQQSAAKVEWFLDSPEIKKAFSKEETDKFWKGVGDVISKVAEAVDKSFKEAEV